MATLGLKLNIKETKTREKQVRIYASGTKGRKG